MVRLKASVKGFCFLAVAVFQFLMVRLKGLEILEQNGYIKFQFLMVRLKEKVINFLIVL